MFMETKQGLTTRDRASVYKPELSDAHNFINPWPNYGGRGHLHKQLVRAPILPYTHRVFYSHCHLKRIDFLKKHPQVYKESHTRFVVIRAHHVSL